MAKTLQDPFYACFQTSRSEIQSKTLEAAFYLIDIIVITVLI